MDDQPLFGEKKSSTQIVQWATAGTLLLFVVYCLIIAVIYGIKGTWAHFAIAFLLVVVFFQLAVTFFFMKSDTQEDAKFLWLCIFGVVVVILTGTVLNIYVWAGVAHGSCPTIVQPPCANCTGDYAVFVYGYSSCVNCAFGQYVDPYTAQCVAGGGNGTNGTNTTQLIREKRTININAEHDDDLFVDSPFVSTDNLNRDLVSNSVSDLTGGEREDFLSLSSDAVEDVSGDVEAVQRDFEEFGEFGEDKVIQAQPAAVPIDRVLHDNARRPGAPYRKAQHNV